MSECDKDGDVVGDDEVVVVDVLLSVVDAVLDRDCDAVMVGDVVGCGAAVVVDVLVDVDDVV